MIRLSQTYSLYAEDWHALLDLEHSYKTQLRRYKINWKALQQYLNYNTIKY